MDHPWYLIWHRDALTYRKEVVQLVAHRLSQEPLVFINKEVEMVNGTTFSLGEKQC